MGTRAKHVRCPEQIHDVSAMSAYLERAECLCLPPCLALMLAGGLTAENVAARAALVRPWMVDAASGVESAPGLKDLAKVRALVQALRGRG